MINKTECENKLGEDNMEIYPMLMVNKILSGKWKIIILWYLSSGTLRFSELKKKLSNVTQTMLPTQLRSLEEDKIIFTTVTQKMLTSQLRSLEEDKLISRTVYPVVPPKVEYSLTETGKKFIPILKSMHDFGEEYIENLLKEDQIQENKE